MLQKTTRTKTPPLTPPGLTCPICKSPLHYAESYIAGTRMLSDQWDLFRCLGPCGEFEYRHRTKRLASVENEL